MQPEYIQVPLNAARSMVQAPAYAKLREQQHAVVENGITYQPVPPEYLLALGINIIPDGIPICYTRYGKFKRVGPGDHSPLDYDYWYPKPKGAAIL